MSWWYIPFAVAVIVGSSNAVNLTDGLDGLAIGPVVIAATTYMIFAYVAGHARIADYLQITPVAGCGEITVYCGALAGAGLGLVAIPPVTATPDPNFLRKPIPSTGEVIARVGSTGGVSEPQLHFELRRGQRAVDPIARLPTARVSRDVRVASR